MVLMVLVLPHLVHNFVKLARILGLADWYHFHLQSFEDTLVLFISLIKRAEVP